MKKAKPMHNLEDILFTTDIWVPRVFSNISYNFIEENLQCIIW